ncbi:hypothetical protein [Micromonospora sp. WMMD1082]|uniref:hypothetical protein n=1 Tax=Micromonospora sp. WMMD1082 TaxID=3016104 RepID=UPI002417517E|nr:hypothetical protein [Micromonospora sp. WMMD1082]MDG4793713.1 hypothetical protein [Micromonospora sp. WMMD1082]
MVILAVVRLLLYVAGCAAPRRAAPQRSIAGCSARPLLQLESSAPAEHAAVELISRRTPAVQGEGSNERSYERSNEERNDHEQLGEHAPLNRSYPHVDGGEEKPWTGTD